MTNYTIYRLFDYEAGSYIGPEFSRLRDFFEYHVCRTFQQNPECDWRMIDFLNPRSGLQYSYYDTSGVLTFGFDPRKPGMFQNRYVIKDAYGKNYTDPQELFRIRNGTVKHFSGWRHYYAYDDERTLHLPKNNKNKLKIELWSWWYRSIHTVNEHRQNEAHIKDHGEVLVRAKRRRYNLPSTWDDLPNSRWHSRKCWKHNSKRPHQWKEK